MSLRRIWARVFVMLGVLVVPATAAAQPVSEDVGWQQRLRDWLTGDGVEIGLRILLGLALFVAGWLLAKFIAWVIYRALCRTDADNKLVKKLGIAMLADEDESTNQVERTISRVVYYVLMMIVVIAVMQYAGLTQAAAPIESFVSKVMEALPLIGKATLILVIAYAAGLILSKLVTRGLDRLRVDARFAELSHPTPETEEDGDEEEAGEEPEVRERPFSENAGRVIFWVIMVAGLAGAVDALRIAVLAEPLRNAIDRVVTLLPSIAIATVLVILGYIFGRIARVVVANLLDSVGLNRLVASAKLDKFFGELRASEVVGIVAMIFVLIQAAIAGINELGLETLSEPLTNMMAQFWEILPTIGVSLLIAIAGVIGGRMVRGVVEGALRNLRFDQVIEKIGFREVPTEKEGLSKPHQVVGVVAQVAVVMLALVQVLENLELSRWAAHLNKFLAYTVTHAGVALIIVGVGFVVGNYVRDLILARRESERDEGVRWIASFARYAVLVFGFTMAVHHLDVGPNFVLISFALLFGSLCLALALALGLGAREVAGDLVRRQYERARTEMQRRGSPVPGDDGPGSAGAPPAG